MKRVIIYSIAFLIVLFYSLYHANTTITLIPFSIEVEHPSALLHIPGVLLIFFSMQWIYWIGFKQGRKEGQQDCEEINKIGGDTLSKTTTMLMQAVGVTKIL